ncbi:MAG TPA: FN3 associated domain-containing protein [Pedobacter sp.]|nr:FN3 associated domain-containing protein [Pedobacter sp.]
MLTSGSLNEIKCVPGTALITPSTCTCSSFQRVHLPLEEKKHMPPVGKTQLTPLEITILTQWIKKGADFKLRVAKLAPTDTLYTIAANLLKAKENDAYTFEEADKQTVQKLNTANRVVLGEATNSPGLVVNFFHSRLFKTEQLKDLLVVKKQIVSLDLSKMPIKDAEVNLISELENLRMLNLNFTNITGAALSELKKLKYLKTLALSGTSVTAKELQQLKGFAKLNKVYLWNTPTSQAELAQLKQQFKAIHFESGFKGDTIVLKLADPIIENEEAVFKGTMPLIIKHYINGVKIRFTTDGSEPDSLRSPLYKGTEVISGKTFVKAKAYKPGWISSNLVQKNFYTSKYTPDTAVFIIPPEPGYSGKSKMLNDFVVGSTNFRLGNWLAWRFTKMDVLMKFGKPVLVQNITLSSLVDVASYIMPPKDIEIWGGNDEKQLKLLGHVSPEQPTMVKAPFLTAFECKFSPTTVKFIRVKVTPVFSLPSWHPGKGDKAWVFFDEVMVN